MKGTAFISQEIVYLSRGFSSICLVYYGTCNSLHELENMFICSETTRDLLYCPDHPQVSMNSGMLAMELIFSGFIVFSFEIYRLFLISYL
jgi:hypothetical protein